MGASRDNLLEQNVDIGGTTNHSDTLVSSEEPLGLGARVSGQSGSTASLTAFSGGLVTITGLTGMVTNSDGRFITISGAATPANNGTFEIVSFLSATSVQYSNSSATVPDANNGSISWIERNSYMLEDDLNYARTDRRLIKGTTNWYDPVPTYIRPTATSTSVDAHLTNIAGKTTDATGFITERVFYNVGVGIGNTKVTINSVGNLKHSNTIDLTGVPVFDAAPFTGNYNSCYVKIVDGYSDNLLEVLAGPNAGEVIYGITNGGSSTSPDSVEILFYSVPYGTDRSTNSTPYTWESGLTDKISIQYGYFKRLDLITNEELRPALDALSAGSGSGITENEHKALRHLIHFINEGPADGFATGAFKEILPYGNPFPISVTWWESAAKLEKIVEKTYTYNPNKTPSTIEWKMYATDGTTVVATVTDTINYAGVFEISRNRSIV